MKIKFSNIASFLNVTFLATMVPAILKAAEESSFTGREEKITAAASVIGELEDKREESVKYFQMDNGTYQTVKYNESVRFLEMGKYR